MELLLSQVSGEWKVQQVMTKTEAQKRRRAMAKKVLREQREVLSQLRREFVRNGKKRIPLSELGKLKKEG